MQRIHRGRATDVYRSKEPNGSQVVVKLLRGPYPSREDLAAFEREARITRRVQGAGIIRLLRVEPDPKTPRLILEDYGAHSLAVTFRNARADVDLVLRLALGVLDGLEHVHLQKVVHKDINPANVVWDAQSGQVKLIDFGLASETSSEEAQPRGFIEGTLSSIAPEQTGRLPDRVGPRSDFYSFGATLFELLTGRAVFTLEDPLSLVHAHVAVTPPTLREIDPTVPAVVSDIVGKLLAKAPDDRYQSVEGLRHDLELAGSMGRGVRSTGFVPGEHDIIRDLRLPATLYGRQPVIRELVRVVRAGEIAFLAGSSGVGKTALANAVRRELATSRARMVSGKFDPFRGGVPYAAVIEPLRELVRQVLTEPIRDLEIFRVRVRDALGANARVLAEVVPELEILLGRLTPVPALPPSESENRFLRTLRRFVHAASTEDRPLVFFLDDLQWADAPSLRLVRALSKRGSDEGEGRSHVSILGAYRADEVGPEHPLTPLLEVERVIELRPLSPADVSALLADTLDPSGDDIGALAEVAIAKTRGNPLFLRRFLRALVERGTLTYEAHSQGGKGGWRWNLAEVKAYRVSDNVVRFLASKLGRLPEATLEVLHVASLIGDRFDPAAVAAVLERSEAEVREALHAAVDEEVVVARREGIAFRFAHDRIRQAVRSLADPRTAAEWHARIGRSALAEVVKADSLFDVVGHLERGAEFLDDAERERLVELSLAAGRQALEAVAYQPALALFDTAREHAKPSDVDARRIATQGAADAAYLSGDYARMEAEVERLVKSPDPLIAVAALRTRMRAHISRSSFEDAIDVGLDGLERLGIHLAPRPGKVRVVRDFARTLVHLRGRTPATHASDPELVEPRWALALELLAELAPPAYLARAELLPSIGFAMATIAADHGVNATASYGFALYALVLCALGDYERGTAYADVAEALGERFVDDRMKARRAQLLQGFVRHWEKPVESTWPILAEGFQLGVDSGDFVWATFCAQMYANQTFLGGLELGAVVRDAERYVAAMKSLGQQHVLGMTVVHARAARRLAGAIDPESLDDDALLALLGESNDTGNALFHVVEAHLALLFAQPREALEHSERAAPLMDALPATFTVPIFVTTDIVARAILADDVRSRASVLARGEVARQRLKRWARRAPANFASKRWLVEAELARVAGQRSRALAAYDRAIASARRHDKLPDLALASERAAAYQLALGNESLHDAYLREALFAYDRWGAHGKVAALLQAHPTSSPGETASRGGARTTSGTRSEDLDATAIVKASQALSEELVLDDLVCSLVRIALEVGGSTRALLVSSGEEGAKVEASVVAGDRARREHTLLADADVPRSVFDFVSRTLSDVVLGNAAEEGLFVSDPHVRAHGTRSLLCLPVTHQGELRALLYLENALHRDAFTPQRVEIIRLLTAQAAISLENASLYAQMEETLQTQVALTTAHARFVPHQFLQALERDNITEVRLGDHVEKEMSVLFSDIRGFTSIVENLSPAENIAFINRYLSVMEPAIVDNGGFVDSYIGDAIMALFDGPPEDAVKAGVAMQRALTFLNQERGVTGLPPVRCGIGVNTGALMLGTIGGSTNLKCGVIGDSVNLASRVESLTKHYAVPMLITEHTLRGLSPDGWQVRMVERVVTVGTTEPVTLYEILEANPPDVRDKKLAALEDYRAGIEFYFDRRFAAALGRFASVLEHIPEDLVAQKHVDRCMRYVRSGVPDDWDGVVHMTKKS